MMRNPPPLGEAWRRARSHLLDAAIILWALVTVPIILYLALLAGRPCATVAICAGPIAFMLRQRPAAAAAALIVGATLLRIGFIGLFESDPIQISQLAAERALSGANPYGFIYTNNNPYPMVLSAC
jgi:hypothetical protein